MLAILRARSMAASDGLHTMGVFGNMEHGSGWAKCPIMSKISVVVTTVAADPTNSISSSSSETVLLWVGFRVSKQIIPSKQSSNPSLLRTLRACTLSAFVKIYFAKNTKRELIRKDLACTVIYLEMVRGTYNFWDRQAEQKTP